MGSEWRKDHDAALRKMAELPRQHKFIPRGNHGARSLTRAGTPNPTPSPPTTDSRRMARPELPPHTKTDLDVLCGRSTCALPLSVGCAPRRGCNTSIVGGPPWRARSPINRTLLNVRCISGGSSNRNVANSRGQLRRSAVKSGVPPEFLATLTPACPRKLRNTYSGCPSVAPYCVQIEPRDRNLQPNSNIYYKTGLSPS